jgi:F0F1-type ATP synthase assembly protein I
MSEHIPKEKRNRFNLLLAAVTGQVGCLTMVIVIGAVLLGIYLDAQFGTKPWLTVGLLVASIPISLVLMFFVVRKAVSKLKVDETQKIQNEEDQIGKNS